MSAQGYYLDGYNLLFSSFHSTCSLASQREALIDFLQKSFSGRKIRGALIFDGDVGRAGESGRSYSSPLEIIYTPHHESADAYILEKLEGISHRSHITVVTNDRILAQAVRALGAKTMKNEPFLKWLKKKPKKSEEKPEIKETAKHFERLLKLFSRDPEDKDSL